MTSPAPLDEHEVLSPGWLGETLATRWPGTRVERLEVVERLETIATKVRFRVEYAENPSGAPEAMCVKGYFGPDGAARASTGRIEALFYLDVAPGLSLNRPPCVHAAVDPETQHGLVLMEDLVAGGCRFLTALSPYSPDEVARTLEQLARLHGKDSAALRAGPLRDADYLAPRLPSFLEYVDEARLQTLLDDGRADDLPDAIRSAARVREALRAVGAHSAANAQVLVHGDTHAGNLYLDPDGNAGLIDWQVVQWGAWELDVAYHLSAVLETADREANERALVAHYLDALRAAGGEPPAEPDAWEAYRRALAYGYFMWSITQRVERPVIEVFMQRMGAAVAAHESFDRLGV